MNQNWISRKFFSNFFLILVISAICSLAFGEVLPPRLEVDFINVGLDHVVGDSILLRSSEGKVVLIDGGFPGAGALRYLVSKNINHIDMVVLTHVHDDHSGGLIDVLKAIPVDRVIINGQTLDSPIFLAFEQAVREAGITPQVVRAGDQLPFGRLTFQVLHPRKINPATQNDNSIVLRLAVGKVIFMFTGDMQKLSEDRLLATGMPLHTNILKIAHHGASTSSSPAFITRLSPEVAIYSSGKGNMHGLPHQETFETLEAVGVEVYGTDENGNITVVTDGSTYTVIPEYGGPRAPFILP